MATKTYVLSEHTKPTANVYVQVNANQKVRVGARRLDRPALQIGFTDKEGKNKVIRLKLSSNKIYQDEQIKDGILANEKFTQKEYEAPTFRHGLLTTKNETVQAFLDIHPENEKFWELDENGEPKGGYCDEIKQPLFKEYDRTVEIKSTNNLFKKRLAAANRIGSLTLEEGKKLMIRLNGSHLTPPNDLDEIQNFLVDWLDETDEDGMDQLIRKDVNADEEATIVVSQAIENKIISFDKIPGKVVKLKGANTVDLKEIPEGFAGHDAQRYFIEFLISDAGKIIYQDLKADVEGAKKKK